MQADCRLGLVMDEHRSLRLLTPMDLIEAFAR
jgi:hypothetical protein